MPPVHQVWFLLCFCPVGQHPLPWLSCILHYFYWTLNNDRLTSEVELRWWLVSQKQRKRANSSANAVVLLFSLDARNTLILLRYLYF
jgi:hypothetical protein